MQQGGGGVGGGQFGLHPPKMPPFSSAGSAGQRISVAETPSPISSRPPAPAAAPGQQVVEEQGPGGGFDEEALVAGEEGASGGAAGNRWPRQETLALLKIRSDMDATFRDATLKGPLWEEVSRKLAEEGYRRSSKKCKEKFENVHKYYKRTKDSRAGRNDGKTYRFFQQLEALHGTGAGAPATAVAPVVTFAPPTMAVGVSGVVGPSAVRAPAEPPPVSAAGAATAGGILTPPVLVAGGNMSFSTSNTEEYSDEEDSDDEGTEEMDDVDERGKRKRMSDGGAAAAPSSGGGSGKMMRFFEGLMKQVMERQEAMQHRFLEAIEKREEDRMIREEAWRRQEMVRLAREQEILAQERAMAASRDAAVLSFIQKITGQTIPMPSIPATAITFMPPPPPSHAHPTPIASAAPAPPPLQPTKSHSQPPPQPQPSPKPHKSPIPATPQPQRSPLPATPQPQQATPQPQQQSSLDIVMVPSESLDAAGGSGYDGPGSGGPASSRWPKAEVHALIQLRSNLDMRYQEAGPKGPLWEEISAGMRRMGYSRSSKRCKEKWENINKYYKKVKDSNKKRPEDSKTCPYFHQLEALYRNKGALSSPSGGGAAALPAVEHANAPPQERTEAFTVAAPISQTAPQPHVTKNGGTSSAGNGNSVGASEGSVGGSSSGMQMQASNGTVPAASSRFLGEAGGASAKKQEDIIKEMMEQRQTQPQPLPQVAVQQQQPPQQATINSYNRTGGGGGADSDNMDEDDDEEEDDYDDEDDDEDDANKMQYEIQFQRQQQHQQHFQQQQPHHNVVRPNAASATGGGNPPGASAPSTAAAATTTAGSFLGMVQ